MLSYSKGDHFTVQKSFEPIFKGLALEDLWTHPHLKRFKIKKYREISTLELDGTLFFVKRYFGLGVGIFKYILRGFRDKYGPENEWHKAHLLRKMGIKAVEPVAFGIERRCGVINRAILVTLKLEGSCLEELLKEEIDADRKTELIKELAAFVGRFHALGLSHQDLYLCHLFWSPDSREIRLLDLQRIRFHREQNGHLRLRWVVKDLAQLDYSSRNVLGRNEYHHLKETFVSIYKHYVPVISEPGFMRKIHKKVARIARHDQKIQAVANGKAE